MYLNQFRIESRTKLEATQYKVESQKDTYVYFYYEDYYYYYDDRSSFEICIDDETEECVKNVKVYKFIGGKKYTIKFNFKLHGDPEYEYDSNYYYYNPFVFFPILDNTIETIESGHYTIQEPKIYNIYLKNTNGLYGFFDNYQVILTLSTNEKLTYKNLDQLQDLTFNNIYSKNYFSNETDYQLLLIIPSIDWANYKAEVLIADNYLNTITDLVNGEFTIPARKNQMLQLDSHYREYINENRLVEYYNVLTTYSSPERNMKVFLTNNTKEEYDFIIINRQHIPLFIDKNTKDIKIKFKTYLPKYTFFGAVNADLYNLYYSVIETSFKNSYVYQPMDIVKEMLPLNVRINSDILPFYEFFNFYFHDSKENINLYINKIYGETYLYECNESLDLNDLSKLTTPISNCKDKKSIFNRLFTFKGTKILSGYLTHNSYFDIYLEFNDEDNKKIKISKVLKDTINSASKYLKKDVEYDVDFTLEHMVKIEPGKNVEVTIYNDEETIKLNSINSSKRIDGKNYKVKSNADIMIYFYGKIAEIIKQVEIENNKKNLLIWSDTRLYFCIDTGFEGYNPSNVEILMDSKLRQSNYYYIENIYEKIEKKLAKNEKLYLFYGSDDIDDVKQAIVHIEYTEDNLNNPNNDYTFNVIPKNSNDKSLIIYNRNIENIVFNINYCKNKEDITIYYKNLEDNLRQEHEIIFGKDNTTLLLNIEQYGTKLRFESTEDFIFSYSFYDEIDRQFDLNEKWSEERKVLVDLTINEIKENNNNNILLITFNPNYKNSNTKYIIVIASEEGDNTEDNFKNPCYITKLVTDIPSGVKVVNFFDVGEKDSIEAEVDITDILSENNKYIVNIISQELRFEKKLNFYNPKHFSHNSIKPIDIAIESEQEIDFINKKNAFELKYNNESKIN